MSVITFTQKISRDLLKFDLNSDVSLANAIRRIILSEIETVGFHTEPYEESDVTIIENTSSLHNEFLSHRLGMCPVNIENPASFDPNKYKFILNVQNTGTKTISVTTKDIEIFDKDTNTSLDNSIFFKENDITKNHILLIKLKSNPGGEGEKINIEAQARRGNGRLNSRFSPVSCVTYSNKIDQSKFEIALNKYIEEQKVKMPNMDAQDESKAKNHFTISESERYFMTDKNDRPSAFEYTIESIGVIPSHVILIKAVELLFLKIKQFLVNFDEAVKSNTNEFVKIRKSTGLMDSMDIIIENENHTLGYLLQSYMEILHKNNLEFVAYRNPHPLKNFIEINIKVENNDINQIKNIVFSTCNSIIEIIKNIKSLTETEFKIQKPKKKLIIKKK